MTPFALGASRAARFLGYHALADLIVSDGLDAHRLNTIFAHTADGQRGRLCAAVMILAGSIERHRREPDTWNGDPEKALALTLIGDVTLRAQRLSELSAFAARIVAGQQDHLPKWAAVRRPAPQRLAA